jgi:hypothetical protein
MNMHPAFEIIRPDEVAECWDGVSPALYQSLWACVPLYTGPTPEESEEPCYGLNALAEWWDLFEEDEQEALNALAERN